MTNLQHILGCLSAFPASSLVLIPYPGGDSDSVEQGSIQPRVA